MPAAESAGGMQHERHAPAIKARLAREPTRQFSAASTRPRIASTQRISQSRFIFSAPDPDRFVEGLRPRDCPVVTYNQVPNPLRRLPKVCCHERCLKRPKNPIGSWRIPSHSVRSPETRVRYRSTSTPPQAHQCEEQDLNLHTLRYRILKVERPTLKYWICWRASRQEAPGMARGRRNSVALRRLEKTTSRPRS
jgi:hypothetical protein